MDRRARCERALALVHKMAKDNAEIEEHKEHPRREADQEGTGFAEEFGERGLVSVSSGSEKKFKGLMPELDPVAAKEAGQRLENR